MVRLVLLGAVTLLLAVACGQEPTSQPARTPTVAASPTPTESLTPTATLRPTSAPFVPQFRPIVSAGPSPGATPTFVPLPNYTATPAPPTPVARSSDQARNLAWAYLSRCISFDPGQLVAYQVKEDWFVKAQTVSQFNFGVWKVDALTGELGPHDVQAREWQPYIESSCSPEIGAVLLPITPTPALTGVPPPTPTLTPSPTRTPTPVPTATPVVPNTSDAVASLWSYLVKCFPSAELADLQAVLDPVTDQYVVKDKNDKVQYGVWRVDRDKGDIAPDNGLARDRDRIVRGGTC